MAARTSAGPLLRVINFHNTARGAETTLRQQLTDLAGRYETIGLQGLHDLFDGKRWTGSRPPLALVFYEGYANNATVAAPILDELELTGWFFLPTAFLDVPPAEQETFALAHDIGLVEEEMGAERLAMTWDEVAALSRRHVIAAHTANHEQIDRIGTQEDIHREIVRPYEQILATTGRPPAATAFLYGAPVDGYPEIERLLVDIGYAFVFSNLKLQRLAAPSTPSRSV
jgi:peptidoglycan/xylan/chitin deacetylase (PgdA/CDA1 family)